MAERGNFFAIGKKEWQAACELGLNAAVAFVVLARGTGRDNRTTTWSREAIYRHTGMTWRRAKQAVDALLQAKLIEVEKSGTRPIWRLKCTLGDDALIWLPNEIVTGAGRETPPIARIRQAQVLDTLRLFIDLYGEQELAGDGGIPRSLLYRPYERKKMCEQGQFDVYAFDSGMLHVRRSGVLAKYWSGKTCLLWPPLNELIDFGLLEIIPYLAESDEPDSELLHPLRGDELAEQTAFAACSFAVELPGGFSHDTEDHEFVLPVLNHMKRATVVGVCRLRYRPKTRRTAAWFARHTSQCEKFTEIYDKLAKGDFSCAA
jgi:hypothetical protein